MRCAYTMSHMALILGLSSMERHLPRWTLADPNYRRAFDPKSCSLAAPFAKEWRERALLPFRTSSFDKRMLKLVDKYGADSMCTLHILADTCPRWRGKSSRRLLQFLDSCGVDYPLDLKLAQFHVAKIRNLVAEESTASHKRALKAEKEAKSIPVKQFPLLLLLDESQTQEDNNETLEIIDSIVESRRNG